MPTHVGCDYPGFLPVSSRNPTLPTTPWECGRMIQGAQNHAEIVGWPFPLGNPVIRAGNHGPCPPMSAVTALGSFPCLPATPTLPTSPQDCARTVQGARNPAFLDGRQRPDSGSRSCVSPPSCYSLGHLSEGPAVSETGIRQV